MVIWSRYADFPICPFTSDGVDAKSREGDEDLSEGPEGLHILFIQRSSSLSKDEGQIAFPACAVDQDVDNRSSV